MSRTPANEPANVLRAALSGPFSGITGAAEQVIRRALRVGGTWGEVADRLGITRRSLERLRVDFPEVFR